MTHQSNFVVWFSEVDKEDVSLVGGKGANLGEMTKFGIPVPPGFIVTAPAYFHFLEENKLPPKIRQVLKDLNVADPVNLARVSQGIKKLILGGKIPKEIADLIIKYYFELAHFNTVQYYSESGLGKLARTFTQPLVAVRSSATAEDLPTASFAGQQATFLNVKGEANVIEKIRQCWASLFEPRAIFYRAENNFDHFKVGMAVPVQKMVEPETSGVMFTVDPVTGDRKKITIEAIFGLGELLVQGAVAPDHYEMDKKTLEISKKEIGKQTTMLVKKDTKNVAVAVPKKIQERQKLTSRQIQDLAGWGKKIEHHYFFPQDIEWAMKKGKVYIVQTRPVTTIRNQESRQRRGSPEVAGIRNQEEKIEHLTRKLPLLLKGDPASPGIAIGPVKIVYSAREIHKVFPGEVLVTPKTNPDFVPVMKKAVAIVTDLGGRTSHAAIVARELGIPCIVGTEKGTKVLKNGWVVTVNGGTGEVFRGGMVGIRNQESGIRGKTKTDSGFLSANSFSTLKTATKLYVNLAEPERAAEVAKMDVDGVGLLRAEFMIAQIGVHPKKIIHDRKQKMFVKNLAENLTTFCSQFQPRPIVYRLSDFKTNEYRHLLGGKFYEPEEENPFLGYRGCLRYLADPAPFEMELEAIKTVRNKYGCKNLWLMIPFVRTPLELQAVKKMIAAWGLVRSPSFKIWIMVEVPSNVIFLEKFIEVGIDGISVGSNDLTMLILGADRDNSEVASSFNERDEAVFWALERVIKTCRKYKITSSICGQAPSDFPDLVEKLVFWGINSISVNPDALIRTRQIIYATEKRIAQNGKN